MNIELPPGWESEGGSVEYHKYLAQNENGISVGINPVGSTHDSWSVWAGDDWSASSVVSRGHDSENAAKLAALEWMEDYPDAYWDFSVPGRGRLIPWGRD